MTDGKPRWLNRQIIDMIHFELIVEHGGTHGTRADSDALLESALERPRNKLAYEAEADLSDLAAAYMFGLVKNHGYLDGNKRVAFAAAATFLLVNGLRLTADEAEAYAAVAGVADNTYSEEWLSDWLRRNTQSAAG